MKDFLSPDSLIGGFLTTVFNLLLLNLIWMFSSVFIVTIGASTIALYTVTFKMTGKNKMQQGIVKTYFKALKDNFKQSLPITFMFYAVFGILIFDLQFYRQVSTDVQAVLYGVSIALFILAVIIFEYIFPLVAIFDNSFKGYLVASIKLSIQNIPLTIVVFFVNVFIPMFVTLLPGVASNLTPVLFLFGGSVVAYIVSHLMNGMMEKLKENSTN